MSTEDKDFEQAQEMFTEEDLDGGFHNVQPPPEFYEEQERNNQEAQKFIEISDVLDELPQKSDKISVAFTPEEMMFLVEILEQSATTSCSVVDYARKELNMDLYQQQGLIRKLRNKVGDKFDDYVRLRPFTPFLVPWFNRIGKGKVRKGDE